MRAALRWTSVLLFVGLGGFLLWFGWLYANVGQILPFHAAALPEAARESMKPLYFALMNLIGGASAALGVLGAYVALVPLRRGAPLAAAAIAATYAIAFLTAAVTAEELAAATGAPTTWHIMGVLLAITALAWLANAAAALMARRAAGKG